MDRIHNTRRRTAQRAAEVTINPAPEPMGQVRQTIAPRPLKRGRGRGRATGAGQERGQGMAGVEPINEIPLVEPQIQPNLTAVLAAVQRRLETQDAILERLHNVMQQAPVPPAPILPAPQVINQVVPAPLIQNNEANLYERFRRARAPEFEGSYDPLVADEWLAQMERIFNFMGLTDFEKVKCASFVLMKEARYWWDTVAQRKDVRQMAWAEFVGEFKEKYFNQKAMSAQQSEFSNLRQGTMTVSEAMDKFNRLARLCQDMVKTEEDRVRRMMEMFRPELELNIDSGSSPPTTVADCLSRAIKAEYRLNQVKEDRVQAFKARKEEKNRERPDERRPHGGNNRFNNHNHNRNSAGRSQNHSQNQVQNQNNNRKRRFDGGNRFPDNRRIQQRPGNNNSIPTCRNCGRVHPGECRKRTFSCYTCGQAGYFQRDCPTIRTQGNLQPQQQPRNSAPQLHAMQAVIEGPSISQGRLEAPKAQLFAYTNADTLASTSNDVMLDCEEVAWED